MGSLTAMEDGGAEPWWGDDPPGENATTAARLQRSADGVRRPKRRRPRRPCGRLGRLARQASWLRALVGCGE